MAGGRVYIVLLWAYQMVSLNCNLGNILKLTGNYQTVS